MTKLAAGFLAAVVLCGVAGCARTHETRYYTLDMAPAGTEAGAFNLAVGRIRASESLTNRKLQIRRSPTEIEYYASDQWASSIPEMVTEKLKAEFGAYQNTLPTLDVSGDILAFEQEDRAGGAVARIRMALELRRSGDSAFDQPLMAKTYDIAVDAADAKPQAVAAALSRGVERLAAEIRRDAAQFAQPGK